MTTFTGNSGVITVDGNALAEVTAWSVTDSADRVEDTALGDSNRTYKSGLADVEGSLDCHWDDTDTSGAQALLVPGASVALILDIKSGTTGDPRYSITATILSVTSAGTFNEIVNRNVTWAAAGAGTWSTVP